MPVEPERRKLPQRSSLRRARAPAILVIGFVLGWPALAPANGRFPAANSLVFEPDDGGHFVVRTTFGLLDVRDAEQVPSWTCEKALGFSSDEDPLLVITASGARVLATSSGTLASNGGCDFRAVAELKGQLVADLALDLENDRVLGVLVETAADGTTRSQLFELRADGTAFELLGQAFAESLLPITLDVARTDGDRIYLSARLKTDAGYSGVLLTSRDGGDSFEQLAIADTGAVRLPYVAAISPTDPERVYVRVNDPDGSVLWTSRDGGRSLERTLRGSGRLLGFAVSPDGRQIAFGGPEDGVWRAASDGSDAERVNDLAPTCLSWSDTGLYACGSFTGEEAFVHRSLDVGERFEGLFWKSQLEGATGCGLDTAVGSLCDAAWPAIAASLGTPMLPPEPPGSGQGGSGDSGPDGDAEPEPPGSQSRASDGGCSVGSGNRPARASWPSLASALLAACAVLRRARLPSPGRSPTREH